MFSVLLSDAYLQVSLESNNYPQAVEDLSKAVAIKIKTAPVGSMPSVALRLAESYTDKL